MKTAGIMLMVALMATAARAASNDSAWATKIAQVGIAEVELGKLATGKAMRDDVKKFAQQMVDDHSKANDELKALAMKKNITLPSDTDAEHKALYDRLSKLSGAAFDQAYMQAMVDGHRKVVAEFQKEKKSGSDADVKEWAGKTLPTIEEHLKHAQQVSRGHSATSTH